MILQEAKEVLKKEAESILHLIEKLGPDFEQMVEAILDLKGRVIISGIGKSGLIGKKIVATLTSTGTNAMFLHPVEAMHGDLGMVLEQDLVIAISNSGETRELNQLLPSIKALGCTMVAFTGNCDSTMAKLCDLIIDTGVEREACPLGLAPTCSTTAQLAMGDALAVVLIKKKNFKESDFKRSHPGGALGQRLSCMVKEIMDHDTTPPVVALGDTMTRAIGVMEEFKLGAVLVIDGENRLLGIITDGDIRHSIANGRFDFKSMMVQDIMSWEPYTILPTSPLFDALNIMEKHEITALPVIDTDKKLIGILHLHDILGKGAFRFNGS
ncbi:MAG: KpsF/GutQ family sugar-phosphate isomerase [Desulfobacterium sp.]|nr:KpsF/GutQ family sugar-phosphate isomerase [Desulfobacterium sp.]